MVKRIVSWSSTGSRLDQSPGQRTGQLDRCPAGQHLPPASERHCLRRTQRPSEPTSYDDAIKPVTKTGHTIDQSHKKPVKKITSRRMNQSSK